MERRVAQVRPRVTAPIDCPVNRNGNMRRARGRPQSSGGVTTTRVQTTMPGSRKIPAATLIPWDRSLRMPSVFTTWSATSGNGLRIVMLTPTPMRRRMGEQAKRERVVSASIGAAPGYTLRGYSAQPPARGIPPTTGTSLWGFGSTRPLSEAGKQIKESHSNETNTSLLAVGRTHLYRERRETGHTQRCPAGQPVCASWKTRFREWIPVKSLLHGERLAHRRLRFRMGRLGASVVEGAARGRQIYARLQL